jgi:hypothetical protein
MSQFHEGQAVKVLRYEDTFDAPWSDGKIMKIRNGAIAPGYQAVAFNSHGSAIIEEMAHGGFHIIEERFIRPSVREDQA